MSVDAATAAATHRRRAARRVRDRRQRDRRQDRSERDVPRHPDGAEEDGQRGRDGQRGQDREDAARRRDALAAAEAQPDRIDVADDRRESGRGRHGAHVEPLDQHHAGRAFGDVEQHRRGRPRVRLTRAARSPRRGCRCRCGADRRAQPPRQDQARTAPSRSDTRSRPAGVRSGTYELCVGQPSIGRPRRGQPALEQRHALDVHDRDFRSRPGTATPSVDPTSGSPAIARASDADGTAVGPAPRQPRASRSATRAADRSPPASPPDIQVKDARRAPRRKHADAAKADPERGGWEYLRPSASRSPRRAPRRPRR